VLYDTHRMGPLIWLKENPGRQLLTGSFHPVEDEFWEVDAYRKKGESKSLLDYPAFSFSVSDSHQPTATTATTSKQKFTTQIIKKKK